MQSVAGLPRPLGSKLSKFAGSGRSRFRGSALPRSDRSATLAPPSLVAPNADCPFLGKPVSRDGSESRIIQVEAIIQQSLTQRHNLCSRHSMVVLLLVVGMVWIGLAAVFVLALAVAAHQPLPEPEVELGFVVRRFGFERPSDCGIRPVRASDLLLK